jgi:chromosome segregation ATPase
MDSQTLTVLIGAASLVVGFLACWLVMRGRIAAAAAQGKAKAENELAQAKERLHALDNDRQLATANFEEQKLQAAQSRKALDLARKEQAQLAKRASQADTVEAELTALQAQEKVSKQELLRLSASAAEHSQTQKQASARLVAAEDENAALKRNLAELSATLQELSARPVTPATPHVTELPLLEIRVVELLSLAKGIEQEFLVLQDVQRNFTAASSALQDVS